MLQLYGDVQYCTITVYTLKDVTITLLIRSDIQ